MPTFKPLSKNQFDQLIKIRPSRDGYLVYYPAKVHLKNNKIIDRVYIVEQSSYFKASGFYPKENRQIKIEDIVKIEDSPARLPFQFADQLYNEGESGMGYYCFVVIYNDDQEQAYLTGGAIDFINYPEGKGPDDVIKVIPHAGRNDPEHEQIQPFYWCIYAGISD